MCSVARYVGTCLPQFDWALWQLSIAAGNWKALVGILVCSASKYPREKGPVEKQLVVQC